MVKMNTEDIRKSDQLREGTIEEIVDLIRSGHKVDVLYQDASYPYPNIITLVCEGLFCEDVREIKPIISSHSSTQIFIRSHDKDNIITSWKEFYITNARIFINFKVDQTMETIQTEEEVSVSEVVR